ncbi:MAG TPA: hypothetical protein GX504_00450 [Clostridia bacterium]|nr:hypothetical protein [Clostridia bacterium]
MAANPPHKWLTRIKGHPLLAVKNCVAGGPDPDLAGALPLEGEFWVLICAWEEGKDRLADPHVFPF